MICRGRRACAAVLGTVLLLLVLPAPLAQAADTRALQVQITGLSPELLTTRSTITLSGTVTNVGDDPWTDVQAYLVIPFSPFTTREQVEAAVGNGGSYTGERVVELDSIDDLGTLEPGASADFRVRVPPSQIRISGIEGVYPVGVQILATDAEGVRDNAAVGRATSFVPLLDRDRAESSDGIAGGIVWPFVMPQRRGPEGRYTDSEAFAASVSEGGQLRNLLDLATDQGSEGTTILLDPALLVGLDHLAEGKHLSEDAEISAEAREAARLLLDDLVDLARNSTCWVIGYDRPDLLAIAGAGMAAEGLTAAVDRATRTTLQAFGVTGRRVSWPPGGDVGPDLLGSLAAGGGDPALVPGTAVPAWRPRLGSLVRHETDRGPLPLLVASALDEDVPGPRTPTTLRQRLLAEAALAALQRPADPESRADAFAVVDPTWDPGPLGEAGDLSGFLDAPFVDARGLDELVAEPLASYEGPIRGSGDPDPLGTAQVDAVATALRRAMTLADLVPEPAAVQDGAARRVAETLGVKWRDHREQGEDAARALARRSEEDLASITVEGPPAVTLASSTGSFPLTLSNGTEQPIRVGVRVDSSNPSLEVEDIEAVDVGAGQRLTVNVSAEVGTQSSSTFTARLTTPDGEAFGESAVFNVRSSRVGVAVWVAMGGAGLLVVGALARRFRRRGEDDVVVSPAAPDGEDEE